MEADQSFDEDDDDDEEEEEEDVKTSKKRPAASPASKSQVSLSAWHRVTPQPLVQLGSTLTRRQCPCRRKWRWKLMKTTTTMMKTMTMSEYWVELNTVPKKYLCVINAAHNRESHSDHLAAPRPSLVSVSSQENTGALCCVAHTAEGIVWFSVWLSHPLLLQFIQYLVYE